MNTEKLLILGDINIQSLVNMKKALTGILREAKNKEGEVYRTYQMAAVQAFEISYELTWKILQKILRKYSIDVRFSKEVFLKAADIRLMEDPKVWFKFLEKRNETVHAYDENLLDDIFNVLPDFITALESLTKNLKKFDLENKNYDR